LKPGGGCSRKNEQRNGGLAGGEGERLEIGDWRLEIGDWRLMTGDWRLEIGDWRLEIGDS
jgi:hypothetical protein